MSRVRILALAGGLAAIAGSALAQQQPAQPQPAQQQPDARADVQAFVKQYIDAINRAEGPGIMELYAKVPDVTSADNVDIVHGWDAIRNDVAASLAQSHYRMILDSVKVVPLGTDYALAVARATYTFGTAQGSLRVRGVLTLVMQKIGGSWKVLHDHSSSQNPG